MRRRAFLLLLGSSAALPAWQKYSGPRPSKPDLPCLLHGDELVPTEALEAKEEGKKDEVLYTMAGASSPVRTPLASPIFLMQAEKIQPERLALFKLDSRNGRREILFKKKKQNTRPLLLTVNRLSSDNLYRIEVVQSLENGEYSLSPEGSNQVFCFQVY